MREIEFRGKCKNGDGWVYGVPVKSRTNCGNWSVEMVENIEYETDFEYATYVQSEEVAPETVGQYTGLKDKNGKKIFEGDIVRTNYKEVREYNGVKYDDEMGFVEKIVWSKDYNGWCLEIEEMGIKLYRRLNFCEEVNGIKLFAVEVIGNVYDTPELLEEEE